MKLNVSKKPIIIQNSDFQTIIVRVMFPCFEDDNNIIKLTLLPNLLMYMNNKYPTEEEFNLNRKKNYILSMGCSKMVVGENACLCFSMVIPDVKNLGFDNLDSQFEFFREMIYNPKVVDQGLDPFEVEREKKNLLLGVENGMKKIKTYQAVKGLELIDDKGILSRSFFNHADLVHEVTPKNLYEFYLGIIKAYKPFVFVFGNCDEKRISNLVEKYILKDCKGLEDVDKKYNNFLTPASSKPKMVNEKSHFKDSTVSLYYKVKDMKEDDFNFLSLVKSLLTSQSSRMLNKKLRDENNLVYSSRAISYPGFGVLEITAYISKDNKDITIEKIKEVIEDIKNPEVIRDYLENIKERRRISLIKSLDDKFSLLNDQVLETLEIDKNMQDSYLEIKKITAEEVSSFTKRLVLDTVYFIEEGNHE